jgi:hypothetical protein
MVKKKDLHSDSATSTIGDDAAPVTETASTTALNYDVGYGKPPKATQWQKGQSGNPKGKKRGMKSFKELFLDAAKKKITVKDANGLKEVSQLEALFAFTFTHAIKGNYKHMAHLMALAEKFFRQTAPDTAQEALDKLDEALKACPGYHVIAPNQLLAIRELTRLYGPGSESAKRRGSLS